MRQICNLPQRADAVRFAAFLVTQGINAHAEEANGQWTVWVREEDQLSQAKQALAEFLADPTNSRYQNAEKTADTLRREEITKRESARQNVVDMSRRWGGHREARRRPLTISIIILCTGLGIASNMGQTDPNDPVQQALKFFDMRHLAEGWQGQTLSEKFIDVSQGQLWRVFTPAFLHGNVWHLAMNMVLFYQLAASIEHRRGTWRLGLLILATAFISNLAQAAVPNEWGGTANFVGLSGVVYGLFGYTWMKSRYEPQLGLYIDRFNTSFLLLYLVLGFLGAWNVGLIRVANWAHGVGFLTGVIIGIAPVLLRRSQQP